MLKYNNSGNKVTTIIANERNKKCKSWTSSKIFVIIFILTGIAFCSLFSPAFELDDIIITGNNKVAVKDVLNLSGISMGVNIFRVSLAGVKKNIYRLPYVDTINIRRVLPRKIMITIREKKPVGCIPFMGSFIIIDKDGYVLEVASQLEELQIPQIIGLKFNKFILGQKIQVDDVAKLDIIVSSVKEILHYNLLEWIIEIDVHDTDNIQLIARNSIAVDVGDKSNMNYKICFLKEILNQLDENEKGYINLNIEKPTFKPIN